MRTNCLSSNIMKVLIEEAGLSNKLMDCSDIAKAIFGVGYTKSTKYQLEKTIRTNMTAVIEKAAERNIVILPFRAQPKQPNRRATIIVGWKVADLGDERAVMDELIGKKAAGISRIKSFISSARNSNETGLISDKEVSQQIKSMVGGVKEIAYPEKEQI